MGFGGKASRSHSVLSASAYGYQHPAQQTGVLALPVSQGPLKTNVGLAEAA